MRFNICIDIDGTITDPYYWLKYINKYFNKNITQEEFVKFDVCRILNISEDDFNIFYDLMGEKIHGDCIAREHAKEIIEKLNKDNNIYFVTARPEKYREVSEKWLRDNGFKGDLFMVGGHDKIGQATELHCDYFVEDRYKNAVVLSKVGIKVFLMDTNYNRYPLIENITRVASWKDIDEELNKI